jgi:GNAT superfamily N-acetyltransferase
MNLFFRILGEAVERIRPGRWTESNAKKRNRFSPERQNRGGVTPRSLQSTKLRRGSHRQHAHRRPPRIALRREGIWRNRTQVGEFVSDHAVVTPEFVLEWAKSSRNLTRYLRKLRLPAEFTWYYVDVVTVHQEWRGQGIAKAVFNKIGNEHRPVLIMLIPAQPRSIGWGTRIEQKNAEDTMDRARRLAVYRHLGFDVVPIKNRHFGKGTIGFKFVK